MCGYKPHLRYFRFVALVVVESATRAREIFALIDAARKAGAALHRRMTMEKERAT
jgi:hypothetical protein